LFTPAIINGAGTEVFRTSNLNGNEWTDWDGKTDKPVWVRVEAIIKGDELTFDFTKSDPQCTFVNCPIGVAVTDSAISAFFIVDASVPKNGGAMRPIHLIAPEGSVVNPIYPATVGASQISVGLQIVEATGVSKTSRWPNLLGIDSDRNVPDLKELTDRVHQVGTPIAIQLVHPGGTADPIASGCQPLAPSSFMIPKEGKEIPRAMTIDEIDQIVEDKAISEQVKWNGYRLIVADGTRVASTRMYTSLPEMWEGWTKNVYLGLHDRAWCAKTALHTIVVDECLLKRMQFPSDRIPQPLNRHDLFPITFNRKRRAG
jgi:hypothetical protein